MNHFDYFGLPYSLNIDTRELKKRYLAKSREYHPDFFTLHDAAAQEKALEQSAQLNKAYQTLSQRNSRIRYMLEISGMAPDAADALPQDFLMEMMELNEALMELEFEPDDERIKSVTQAVAELEVELNAQLQPLFEKPPAEALTRAELETLKDYCLKFRYLLRIRENLAKFAPA